MKTQKNSEKSKKTSFLRIALFSSLAVNLLILGIVAGGVFGSHGHKMKQKSFRGNQQISHDLGIGRFSRALNQEQRQALRKEIGAQKNKIIDKRKALHENMLTTLSALEAEPVDKAKLEQGFAGQRNIISQAQQVAHAELIEFLMQMPSDERNEFIARAKEQFKKHKSKR